MSKLENLIVKTIIAGAFLVGLGGCGGAGTKILLEDIKQQDITHQTENKESAANEDIQEDVFYKNNQEVGEEDVKQDEQKDISVDKYGDLQVPNCLEGEIEKIECLAACPEDNPNCDPNPCKSYATIKCVNGEWGVVSECESFKKIISGDSDTIFHTVLMEGNDILIMSLSVNSNAQLVWLYNIPNNTSEKKLEITSGDGWIYGLSKFKNGKALISGYEQQSFVFDIYNDEIAPIIFSSDFDIGYLPFCEDFNESSVFCTEIKKHYEDDWICIVEHSLVDGKEMKDYCEELFLYSRFIYGLGLSEDKLAFAGVTGTALNGQILGLYDLNTAKITVVDKRNSCGMYDFHFGGNNLAYVFKNSDCDNSVQPDELYRYNLKTKETESITKKSGLECMMGGYSSLYDDNFSCLTSYFPDALKLHLINLNSGESAEVMSNHARANSLSKNQLVFEHLGEIRLCELKDEWVQGE